jgi:hypothetical protein
MNLVGAVGMRTVYSWTEVCAFLGMTRNQVHSLVYNGKLIKRHAGSFPFAQKDVNQFITHLNAGEIEMGVRNRVGPKRGRVHA